MAANFLNKLIVSSLLYDSATFNKSNAVGISHRSKTVCDHNNGYILVLAW
jgi:hypothetical protein